MPCAIRPQRATICAAWQCVTTTSLTLERVGLVKSTTFCSEGLAVTWANEVAVHAAPENLEDDDPDSRTPGLFGLSPSPRILRERVDLLLTEPLAEGRHHRFREL